MSFALFEWWKGKLLVEWSEGCRSASKCTMSCFKVMGRFWHIYVWPWLTWSVELGELFFAFVMYNCHDTWLMFVQAQKTLVDQSQVFLSDNLRSSDVHLRNGVGTQVNTISFGSVRPKVLALAHSLLIIFFWKMHSLLIIYIFERCTLLIIIFLKMHSLLIITGQC